MSDQHHGVLHRHVSMFWGEGQSCIFEMLSSLQTNRSASSPVTLWCPEQDVDGAGAVHLVLLGNDDGEGCASSAHVLQSLGQRHLCVEEDQIHHHSQVADFAAHRFGILPTVVSESKDKQAGDKCAQARYEMKHSRNVSILGVLFGLDLIRGERRHTFGLC